MEDEWTSGFEYEPRDGPGGCCVWEGWLCCCFCFYPCCFMKKRKFMKRLESQSEFYRRYLVSRFPYLTQGMLSAEHFRYMCDDGAGRLVDRMDDFKMLHNLAVVVRHSDHFAPAHSTKEEAARPVEPKLYSSVYLHFYQELYAGAGYLSPVNSAVLTKRRAIQTMRTLLYQSRPSSLLQPCVARIARDIGLTDCEAETDPVISAAMRDLSFIAFKCDTTAPSPEAMIEDYERRHPNGVKSQPTHR